MHDVAARLDDQRADAQRSDGVLDDPAAGVVDDAAGQVDATSVEVAGEAALHGRYGAGSSSTSI